MHAEAEICRWIYDSKSDRTRTTMAKGPFVMMMHGLASLPAVTRRNCWIETPMGDVSPEDAAATLQEWSGKAA
jgi:hypothetical protein